MKTVLIISPYFPPSNAADMQRIRMSLPFFNDFGWAAEVVTVNHKHSDANKDNLLLQSIPKNAIVHTVEAFSKKYTSKLGLGSLALRSLWFYKQKVNQLLQTKKYDLIYFSTTQFPVCILGAYWKKKFNIPYVIDMQDPWHSNYYQDKPKNERPAKYWFSYRLNKYLEPMAMQAVGGLISVSAAYISTLQQRYANTHTIPTATITFGAFDKDFEIATHNQALAPSVIKPQKNILNLVYIGRGGADMQPATRLLFNAFKEGLKTHPKIFSRFKIYFLGTSYAPAGQGKPSIQPIANQMGLSNYVTEQTDRLPFYQTLNTLKTADMLFIPGSDDAQYTASKIYPYLMAQKPLTSIFHPDSSAAKIIKECEIGLPLTFNMDEAHITQNIINYLLAVADGSLITKAPIPHVFEKYSAKNMTKLQVDIFERVLDKGL
ncbi:MAG: hypothetical protein EAZ15_10380 [Sphingobacteriales bacterium]|nr:MAG: hypothetical protein EAZ15_10380 [Sphingobacteriales bacterium]